MITEEELENFKTDFFQAVKKLEDLYKIKIEIENLAYRRNDFEMLIRCTSIDNNGNKKMIWLK